MEVVIKYSPQSPEKWKDQLVELVHQNIEKNDFWNSYYSDTKKFSSINIHLGIFVEPYLQLIIEGKKTIESRFSVNRCPPFGRVSKGDILLLKRSGGPIVAICLINDFWTYHLDKTLWDEIKEIHAKALCINDPEFWKQKKNSNYATLMRIKNVFIFNPIFFEKRDRRGWVILSRKEETYELFQ
jgi:hypothetical protein